MADKKRPLILVVEDVAQFARIVQLTLETMPVDYHWSANGQDALDFLREHTPDLVLLDIGLPEMSGWDILAWIREQEALAEVAVVMLTAYSDPENRNQGRTLKVQGYLNKPATPDTIRYTVNRLLPLEV